jgi:hypothetical protein
VSPRLSRLQPAPPEEPLGLLLLPGRLEEFPLRAHARRLLDIPRVVAVEASRRRTPRMLRESVPIRQARRMRLPGRPRLLVLYGAEQYRLARALLGRFADAELWYVRIGSAAAEEPDAEVVELDDLARERATPQRVAPADDAGRDEFDERLWDRLRELGIISSRPFVPGTRIGSR